MLTKEINVLIDAMIDANQDYDILFRIVTKASTGMQYAILHSCYLDLELTAWYKSDPWSRDRLEHLRKCCHMRDSLIDALECKNVS